MKHYSFCCIITMLLILCPHLNITGMPFTHIRPIEPINITMNDECYEIQWVLPPFDISYFNLGNNLPDFSNISFPREIENNSVFHKENILGLPELPFFSINLHIPEGAHIEYTVDDIVYGNDLYLLKPYVPHQSIDEPFTFDSLYYDSTPNDWDEFLHVSDAYSYMGHRGINVHIRPFAYDPRGRILRPIISFKVKICLSGSQSLIEMYENALHDAGYSNAINFFTTYFGTHPNQLGYEQVCSGNFLIITTSEFEAQAEDYRRHKENMGYHATTKIMDNWSNLEIIDYLQQIYENLETRPKYVLIIGYKRRSNESGIPFSSGYSVMGQSTYIDTDIFYACPFNTPNSNSQLLIPQIAVGRWMVKTREELDFIMQKSINYEFASVNRRIAFFSGTDSNHPNWLEDESLELLQTIQTADSSISVAYYSGLQGATRNEMFGEFSDNDDLMFIYHGHGNAEMIAAPYEVRPSYFASLSKLPFFGLGYACSLAMTDSRSGFACQWLNNNQRTCAFYGATCPVYSSSLFNNILWGLSNHNNMTFGELVYLGFGKFSMDYFWSIVRGHYYGGNQDPIWMNEPFILYGDPSLYLYGMEWPGQPAHYIANNIGKDNDKPYVQKIFDINGTLLAEYFITEQTVEDGINDLSCKSGMFFVVTCNEQGNILHTQKIIK